MNYYLKRLTPAQQKALDEMSDGSVLRVSWLGGRGSITKQNGMTIRIQRRVAASLVNSGLLTKLEYDGRLRESYSYQPASTNAKPEPEESNPQREYALPSATLLGFGLYVIEAKHRSRDKNLGPWKVIAAFIERGDAYSFYGKYHQGRTARVRWATLTPPRTSPDGEMGSERDWKFPGRDTGIHGRQRNRIMKDSGNGNAGQTLPPAPGLAVLRPGSNEALEAGCNCPVLDNAHGAGYFGLGKVWVMRLDCPIHGGEGGTRRTRKQV